MEIKYNDIVEDRSMYTGTGRVVYLSGNDVHVRFDDGSEEVVDTDAFVPHDDNHWII